MHESLGFKTIGIANKYLLDKDTNGIKIGRDSVVHLIVLLQPVNWSRELVLLQSPLAFLDMEATIVMSVISVRMCAHAVLYHWVSL